MVIVGITDYKQAHMESQYQFELRREPRSLMFERCKQIQPFEFDKCSKLNFHLKEVN